jgi:hypothetical protein
VIHGGVGGVGGQLRRCPFHDREPCVAAQIEAQRGISKNGVPVLRQRLEGLADAGVADAARGGRVASAVRHVTVVT